MFLDEIIKFIESLFGQSSSNIVSKTSAAPKEFDRLDSVFKATATKYGLDWKMLKAIALNESTLGKNERVRQGLISYDNLSWGLMQFTVKTAMDFDKTASATKLKDEKYSIDLAGQYFRMLSTMFKGNVRDMVMSYNHGQGNQKRFVELEKLGTLKLTEFPAGRQYWEKYNKNLVLVNKGDFK